MTSSQDWDSGTTGPSQGQHTTASTGTLDSPGSSAPAEGSSTKERAQQAADTAKQEGAHVADTAVNEAQQVVGEAKDKAADLLSDARTQLDQQSKSGLQALASKLEELSGEVDSMVQGSNTQGMVTDLARQLSEKTRALSNRLSEREPKDVLEDVRGFARQRPGTFIAGAVVAGVVAGRLTRAAKQAHDEPSASSGSPTAAAGPEPTQSGHSGASAVGGLGGQSVPAGQNTGGRP